MAAGFGRRCAACARGRRAARDCAGRAGRREAALARGAPSSSEGFVVALGRYTRNSPGFRAQGADDGRRVRPGGFMSIALRRWDVRAAPAAVTGLHGAPSWPRQLGGTDPAGDCRVAASIAPLSRGWAAAPARGTQPSARTVAPSAVPGCPRSSGGSGPRGVVLARAVGQRARAGDRRGRGRESLPPGLWAARRRGSLSPGPWAVRRREPAAAGCGRRLSGVRAVRRGRGTGRPGAGRGASPRTTGRGTARAWPGRSRGCRLRSRRTRRRPC